jgi:hypothetical protein
MDNESLNNTKIKVENYKSTAINPNKAVSRHEVSKIIDNFKILNKIIEVNIGGKFSPINSDDLNAFKITIFELNKNFSKENFEYVLNSTGKLEIREEDDINLIRDNLCKYLILLISYLIHFWHQMKSNIFIENILLTLKLIKKLFIEKILTEKEVVIIIKFLLLMSLYTTVFRENVDRRGKNIKYILFIWLGISFLTSLFNKNNENIENNKNDDKNFNLPSSEEISSYNFIIGEIMDFFINILLVNTYNLSIFGDSVQYLSLLEILKYTMVNQENREKIVFALVKIYGNKFDSKILGFFMKFLRESFVDFSNFFYQKYFQSKFNEYSRKSVFSKNNDNLLEKKESDKFINGNSGVEKENDYLNSENNILPILEQDLKIVDSILFFLQKCAYQEKEEKVKNVCKLKNGFMLSETNKTGISLNPIISFPNKGYTLIFSFKWIPENLIENSLFKRTNLISFIQDKDKDSIKNQKEIIKEKDLNIMSIYIEDYKLFISFKENQSPLELNFSIIPNTTYVVNICHLPPGILSLGKSKIYIMINNNFSLSTEIIGYPSGKVKCLVGYGIKLSQSINNLENSYHFSGEMGSTILFSEVFNTEVMNKICDLKTDYEKILFRHYEFNGPINDKELTRNINFFRNCEKYKFEQIVTMLISPRVS